MKTHLTTRLKVTLIVGSEVNSHQCMLYISETAFYVINSFHLNIIELQLHTIYTLINLFLGPVNWWLPVGKPSHGLLPLTWVANRIGN